MKPIELLTTGLIHDSIGDLSILQVMHAELAKRGVPVIARTTATGKRTCVIGGGWLITPTGETDPILKPFHLAGYHVLNAVSISPGRGDFSWLNNYQLISVRDEHSRKTLAGHRIESVCVPCATVLAERPDIDYLRGFPGYDWMERFEPGEYVVCDIELQGLWRPDIKPLWVDTRPFAKRAGFTEFAHRNPDTLLAAIAGAKCVVASSLHLSILSMAMSVPFIWPEGGTTTGKGLGYWARAGLPDVICRRDADYVAEALALAEKMLRVRESEQRRATVHLDQIADLVKDA